MDVFNRPPAISEDTLQYSLYPSQSSSDKASVVGLAALITSYIQSLLPDHIWHRDSFELKAVPDSFGNSPSSKKSEDVWMLEGRMRVGDSVDDEWCVVWLLREISRKWDLAITAWDSDGEFMLIEAAESLPGWVSPSNSENRVWIYNSDLHLIPLSYRSSPSTRTKLTTRTSGHESDGEDCFGGGDGEGWLNVADALKVLRSEADTRAPKEVQEAVWKRVSGYPGAAKQHMHTAKAFIPVDIAKALSKEPSLAQRAVETFYTRDAIQLRAAHRMSRFPPSTSILSPVRMTRTAYAQLVGQKFHPPKVFGQFKEREGMKEWKWRDIGMKLACGFEMLYQESKSKAETTAKAEQGSSEARKDALRRDTSYLEYLEKLKGAGYFRGELEGSQLWNELEGKAVEVFVNSRRNDDASRPSFASLVNSAIAQAGENPSILKSEEESDDWLTIDAESFDDKLQQTMQANKPSKDKNAMEVDERGAEEEETQAQADKLQGFAKKVQKFVEGEGTLEGAVFDDEKSSEDDGSLSEFSDEEFPSDSDEDEPRIVEVDDKAEKAARQKAMDELVPALEASEYGKMPSSFYQNSQAVAPTTIETDSVERSNTKVITAEGQAETTHTSRPIRRPILPRDDFDGVDSDDESEEEEGAGDDIDDELSDEDRPQVIGDVEIDMGAEEEEFLEFSRHALGISDKMWSDMLQERRDRGAFVPKSSPSKSKVSTAKGLDTEAKSNLGAEEQPRLRPPRAGPRPNVNPNLDSFEAVMEAMEAELSKSKKSKTSFAPPANIISQAPKKSSANGKDKGKEKASPSFSAMDVDPSSSQEQFDDDEEKVLAAMDSELRAALEGEEGDSGDEEPMDYGMIRNFLESFKSQGGLAGPVSNLAGRLEPGWKLPRDES